MNEYDVLVVGGGHAGAHCATTLRRFGFEGSICVVSDESAPPYERPPLSKEYLSGEKAFAQLAFHTGMFWAEKRIELRTGMRVDSIDVDSQHVTCEDGTRIRFRRLVWAAGGRARRLDCAGSELAGVHVVRTFSDVDRIRSELSEVSHVVVIGGGFVGLESAASLSKLGKHVTVVEASERLLARVAGPDLGRFVEQVHRAHGVEVLLRARAEMLEGEHGRVCGVRLRDGTLLRAEMVIVGIGIDPAVSPLLAAGAAGVDAIDVDEWCRTSIADCYAIGDCTRQCRVFADGALVRVESVQNAVEQATVVASHLAGRPQPRLSVPWFWSNQYDLRFQTVGLQSGYDDVVIRGDFASHAFSLAYLKAGTLIAIDAINMTKDIAHGRVAIEKRIRPDRSALADPTVPLTTFQ